MYVNCASEGGHYKRGERRGLLYDDMARTWIAVLLVALSPGCADLRTPTKGPVLSEGSTDQLPDVAERLGRGDVIEVRVFMEPDLSTVYPVGLDGAILFPMIGKVRVVQRDALAVAEEIRSRLAEGYLKDPQVTVFVKERTSQKIHVLGQVEKAGTFGFRTGMSVIEAITNAGGFSKSAATNRVRVTRVVNEEERAFEIPAGEIGQGKAPNFELEPGDIVYVPEAIF